MRRKTTTALSLAALLIAGTATACRTTADPDPGTAKGTEGTATGSATGSGSEVDSVTLPASLTAQKLRWKPCPAPSVLQGADRRPGKLPDGTAWQCTTMKVPLDYAKPDGETIDLALIRAEAKPKTESKGRIGSLVFNFGGPGSSGVASLPQFAADEYMKLHERYDLVSFDPRGIGNSGGVRCLDDKALERWLAADSTPDDATELGQLRTRSKAFIQACEKNSSRILPHVDTVSAARDMDLMRQLLGDRRLNYFGISYGTELGGVYAHLFPENVGRTVLDAVVDPTQDDAAVALSQAKGFQLALENFMKDCAKEPDCPTGSGPAARKNTDAGIRKITALLKRLDSKPLKAGEDGGELTQAEALTGMAAALYGKETWVMLKSGLRDAMKKNGDGRWLQFLADFYNGRDKNGRYNNLQSAYTAVICADSSDRYTEQDVLDRLPQFRDASPVFGESMAWTLLTCSGWKVREGSSRTVEVSAKGAEPIVVIGTTGDPATPYEGARRMAEQLGEGVGVEVAYKGEGHGAYPGSDCVTDAVDGYLLDGKVPADGTVCS
ncbi:alpha/beta hydrolase [Nonomuraea sp. NBC_00507]|uniref:alpha/beta hydrolase n=1 Tax=Nonomuraea sp. NBC_00507 TaxID=2976002 RepID=UPI002E16DED7